MDIPFRKQSPESIKANILNPALTSHFYVQVTPPSKAVGFIGSNLYGANRDVSNETLQKINLLCSEANLPGSSLNTHENNNDYVGVTERFAYRRVYDDRIELTFYVDADNYTPIRFFEAWIKYISGESISQSRSPYYSYKFKYPDGEYGYRKDSKLYIAKFERNYNNWLSYDFVGVYPISIVSMPISYDASSLLKCTVHMTYLRYIISPNSVDPKDTFPNEPAASPTSIGFPQAVGQELPFFNQAITISDIAAFNGNNVLLQQQSFTVNPNFNTQPITNIQPLF